MLSLALTMPFCLAPPLGLALGPWTLKMDPGIIFLAVVMSVASVMAVLYGLWMSLRMSAPNTEGQVKHALRLAWVFIGVSLLFCAIAVAVGYTNPWWE